ncbi:MAG: recombination protein RecR [Planctomycetes bacterium]|nr:recombination protein RecR [Planctomycetota bacterium]MBI3845069.1 recombination protein RecR [Planctomycetota bacterium]
MADVYGDSFTRLKEEFAKMPGIGTKSAERLAYHVLQSSPEDAMKLAYAIRDVKKNARACSTCHNVTETDPCAICSDTGRDRTVICVVEQPRDLFSIERTGEYRGLYHVLQGRIAPLEGVDSSQLTVDGLINRVRGGGVAEVILATNPDLEGDGTAVFLAERLEAVGVRVTRIAKGIPTGSQIEFATHTILRDALRGRQRLPSGAAPGASRA